MISRLHLTVLLGVSAVIGSLLLVFNGVTVGSEWLYAVGATVTVVSVVLAGFQHYFWRWRFLHWKGWFVAKPDLNGTWRTSLVSNWIDPDTGEKCGEIRAFVTIRQTYSHLSFRMMTAESASRSVSTQITRAKDGVYRLYGTYLNEPKLKHRTDSPIHYGSFVLTIEGDPATTVRGHYWNDRSSTGELEMSDRIDELAPSFEEAEILFQTVESA